MASRNKGPDPAGLFAYDRGLGGEWVVGADEAGRGSLAGPIVAAAVLFDRKCIESFGAGRLEDLNDSKKMTHAARERVYPEILGCAERVAISMRSARRIDSAGLQVCNIECLVEALKGVGGEPGTIRLVDGFRLPDCELEHRRLVKGDRTSAAVAAASVIAKVTRDRYMVRAAEDFPEYGFDGHKGYGSESHRDAIVEHGPCALHRMSFQSAAYDGFADAA